MSNALLTLQVPSPPDPVPVTLDSATTALLVFDIIEHIAERQPTCREQLAPAAAALLQRARQAGVAVAYGTRAANMSTWLPEVAPTPDDIKIENHGQDRFYNTDLDKILKAKGITTLILTGWKISGSVTTHRWAQPCAAIPSLYPSTRLRTRPITRSSSGSTRSSIRTARMPRTSR
jgi:isochorismate hydrolase